MCLESPSGTVNYISSSKEMAPLSKSCCDVMDIGAGARLRRPKKHERSFSVDGKMMSGDENTMCLRLRIVDQCCDGHSRDIKFPFDVHQDTPVSVMREMQATAVELQISEHEVLSVSLMIMEKVWALQSAVIAERSTAPSTTTQLQRHVQCHEVVERPRRSNRRILNCRESNDSMLSCSNTSNSSRSSASSSKRSQDHYLTSSSSKKLGSKAMSESGAFRYTQYDIDLAFSELNVRDLVASAKLTGLKQIHKQELQEMQQRHTQQYLDLKSRRLQRNSMQCAQPLWCA